ncbi:MAG: hypothetical protein B0D92_06440 [Spirochaeta sp. LUC14_002_19_P3]|nr:MAG: hypothetical protein B0D92_06440 [Spirochaeta sp. LUC14_002_19_P3]
MRHPRLVEWDRRLKAMFGSIDGWLEDKYGDEYSLHPNRAPRGSTANREMDGLFNVGADFTPGYGSSYGRGYIVRIRMVSLEHIPAKVKDRIERDVEVLVRQKLPLVFPNRNLSLKRDGPVLKIVGDFHLGNAGID